MACTTADPETQPEVDLMILDYLLCTTISTVLGVQGQHRDDWGVSWSIDAIDTFKSIVDPPTEDLRQKFLVLDIAKAVARRRSWTPHKTDPSAEIEDRTSPLHSPPTPQKVRLSAIREHRQSRLVPSSEIVVQFLSLCNVANNKALEARWPSITAQLVLREALEEPLTLGYESLASHEDRIAEVVESLKRIPMQTPTISKYINHLQSPPIGITLASHIDAVSKEIHPDQIDCAVSDFLTDVMNALEPPILIQLERGKLNGLSRAETQQLKDRVGMR